MMLAMAAITTLLGCFDDFETDVEVFDRQTKEIEEYLTKNSLDADVVSEYELRYIIHDVGADDGLYPYTYDSVVVTYKLTVLGETTPKQEADSIKFKLDDLIPGFQVLLPLIKTGGKMTMFIQSYYGYGPVTVGDIPANSILMFEVELHEVDHLSPGARFDYDQDVLSRFIEQQQVDVLLDTLTGLRYKIDIEGSGNHPTFSSRINASYSGYFVNPGTLTTVLFDQGSISDYALSDLIEGWQILLPYIKENGSITMYIPSAYAYGANRGPNGRFPSNAIMVFEATLNSISN